MSETWEERMTPRPKPEPKLELLEMVWRFVGPSHRVFDCGIYRTDAGLEVRAGYGRDLVKSQVVVDVDSARELAGEWRQAVLAKGSFQELSR